MTSPLSQDASVRLAVVESLRSIFAHTAEAEKETSEEGGAACASLLPFTARFIERILEAAHDLDPQVLPFAGGGLFTCHLFD